MEDKEHTLSGKQDLLLTDIKEESLCLGIFHALGEIYLQLIEKDPSWPVQGILFGHNSRPFMYLYVRAITRIIKMFFLVDTGSSYAYLSQKVMKALDMDTVPNSSEGAGPKGSFRSYIHGIFIPATYISPVNNHYTGINIIGTDFLNRHEFRVGLNYGTAIIKMYPGIS